MKYLILVKNKTTGEWEEWGGAETLELAKDCIEYEKLVDKETHKKYEYKIKEKITNKEVK